MTAGDVSNLKPNELQTTLQVKCEQLKEHIQQVARLSKRFMPQVDRLFEWDSQTNSAIREALERQKSHVQGEFESNLNRAILNLNEQGLNVALYWKNPDPRKYVNIVPTSAITGEGLPDMLQLVVQLTQVELPKAYHEMPIGTCMNGLTFYTVHYLVHQSGQSTDFICLQCLYRMGPLFFVTRHVHKTISCYVANPDRS